MILYGNDGLRLKEYFGFNRPCSEVAAWRCCDDREKKKPWGRVAPIFQLAAQHPLPQSLLPSANPVHCVSLKGLF